jgi:hypothetical protein
LKIGAAVKFVEEEGEKGPQASTVKLVRDRHTHAAEPTALVKALSQTDRA